MTLSLIVPFEDLETAISTVPKVKMANIDPQALEFMEREIILSSERYAGREVFPKTVDGVEVGAYLMITLDDSDEEPLMNRVEKLAEKLLEWGAVDIMVVDNPQKLRDAWATRSAFLEAIMEETTSSSTSATSLFRSERSQDSLPSRSRRARNSALRSRASATQATATFTSISAATTFRRMSS